MPPEKLGVTLPHEHLLVDFTCWWQPPLEASKMKLVDAPITIEILGMMRRDSSFSRENLKLFDVDAAIEELMLFKRAGGGSVQEASLPGVRRDPLALREVSNATGIHVMTATGWYLAASHPVTLKEKSLEDLSEAMVEELTDGIGDTRIKANICKAALSYPIDPNEEKAMRAAARAQARVGCAYTVHPSLFDYEGRKIVKNIPDILDTVQEEEANLEKLYMSHCDLTCEDLEYHKKIMDTYGVVLGYDTFGSESYWDNVIPGDAMLDKIRTNAIVKLCESGYEKQLLMSHDVATKMRHVKYGGFGYAHILKNIVPALRFRGVTEKQIRTITVDTPKRLLTR
jgi:phosphotriesterase-related protein